MAEGKNLFQKAQDVNEDLKKKESLIKAVFSLIALK